MNKTIFPLLLFLGITTACNRPYTVKGTLSVADKTDTLWLIGKGPTVPVLQSTVVKNGSFTVKVDNDSVDFVSLVSPQVGTVCSFVPVEGESCVVTIADEQGKNIEVKGDEQAQQYYAFRREFIDACAERQSLTTYLDQLKQADSMTLYQQLVLRDTMQSVDSRLTDRVTAFIYRYPDSPYGALALADLLSVTQRYRPTYDLIRERVRSGSVPRSLYQELYRRSQSDFFTLQGAPLPEMGFRLADHQYRSINQYKRSAHLLLCFWDPADAYSCHVAKQMAALEEEYKSQNVTLLFVAITADQGVWNKAVERLRLKGIQGVVSPIREAHLQSDLGISHLPHTLFVTREDKVRFEGLTGQQLTDSLNLFFTN